MIKDDSEDSDDEDDEEGKGWVRFLVSVSPDTLNVHYTKPKFNSLFSTLYLGLGCSLVGHVTRLHFNQVRWSFYLYYSTTWIGETTSTVPPGFVLEFSYTGCK